MTERPLRLVLPHQLFEDHLEAPAGTTFVLVEHDLLFRQYRFHRQKLVLHRASMRRFAGRLRERGFDVEHVETDAATTSRAALADVVRRLAPTGVTVHDVVDDWLGRDLVAALADGGHELTPRRRPGVAGLPHQPRRAGRPLHRAARRWRPPPDAALLRLAAAPARRPGHRGRRPGRRALVLRRGQPQEAAAPPPGARPARRARATPRRWTARSRGSTGSSPRTPVGAGTFAWPTSHDEAEAAYEEFLAERFHEFGPYEDALSAEHPFVFHSTLTPGLNVGLISPPARPAPGAGDRRAQRRAAGQRWRASCGR